MKSLPRGDRARFRFCCDGRCFWLLKKPAPSSEVLGCDEGGPPGKLPIRWKNFFSIVLLWLALVWGGGIPVSEGATLYYNYKSDVYYANTNDFSPHLLYDFETSVNTPYYNKRASGPVIADPTNGKIYFYLTDNSINNPFGTGIVEAQLDGSGLIRLLVAPSEVTGSIVDFQLDFTNRKIYVLASSYVSISGGVSSYRIYQKALDGSNPAVVQIFAVQAGDSYGFAIDPSNGKLYLSAWNGDEGAVRRIDIASKTQDAIYTLVPITPGAIVILPVDIDFDSSTSRLYMTEILSDVGYWSSSLGSFTSLRENASSPNGISSLAVEPATAVYLAGGSSVPDSCGIYKYDGASLVERIHLGTLTGCGTVRLSVANTSSPPPPPPGSPTVSSVSPPNGRASGGETVTVEGNNFASVATVKFGTSSGTNVNVANSTRLTVTTPARSAGTVDVSVTVSGQTGSKASAFTYYDAPTISQVSPPSGTTAGGTTVTITGTNFVPNYTSVIIGGLTASSVNVSGSTSLTAVTPAHAEGAVDVQVIAPGGNVTKTNGFTYTQGSGTTNYTLTSSTTLAWEYTGYDVTDLTALGGRDDAWVTVSLPFGFTFFGTTFYQVHVSTNGLLAFGESTPQGTHHINTSLPSISVPLALIAPFWDDLLFTTSGQVTSKATVMTVGSASNRKFVITWQGVFHVSHRSGDNGVTFQVVLHENTGKIVFNYLDASFGNSSLDEGRSATIGIQNGNGSMGLQFTGLVGVGQTRQIVIELPPPTPPSIRFVSENLDFSTCNVGTSCVSPMRVYNDGGSQLLISSIQGNPSSDFATAENIVGNLVVPANGQKDFWLRFTPGGGGTRTGTITVTSNDPSWPSVLLGVRGQGVVLKPKIRFVSDTLHFNPCDMGEECKSGMTVYNDGDAKLIITGIQGTGNFTNENIEGELSVEPHSHADFNLIFTPDLDCDYDIITSCSINIGPVTLSGTITVTSNDPDTPAKVLQIDGRGDISTIIQDETVKKKITRSNRSQVYTFQASAGERVVVQVHTEVGDALIPWVELEAPDGGTVTGGVALGTLSSKHAYLSNVTLPQTGTYKISVGGMNSTRGTYYLYLHRHSPPSSATPKVVLLIHGWNGSSYTWGNLRQYLEEDGYHVAVLDMRAFGDERIERLGGYLKSRISIEKALHGVSKVDIVAHSMGGLVARAYIAGMAWDFDAPGDAPYANDVGKLILVGVPNLGTIAGTLAGMGLRNTQGGQMDVIISTIQEIRSGTPGFIKTLLQNWLQARFPTDNLYVIYGTADSNGGDGIVSAKSAIGNLQDLASTLYDLGAPENHIVGLPYKHSTAVGWLGAASIVNISSKSHQSYIKIKEFLGQRPDIRLPPSLNFGSCRVGTKCCSPVSIFNDGSATLRVNGIRPQGGGFGNINIEGDLVCQAGRQCDFDITFTPSAIGAHSGTVTVTSDDPDEGSIAVSITGVGTSTLAGRACGAR